MFAINNFAPISGSQLATVKGVEEHLPFFRACIECAVLKLCQGTHVLNKMALPPIELRRRCEGCEPCLVSPKYVLSSRYVELSSVCFLKRSILIIII